MSIETALQAEIAKAMSFPLPLQTLLLRSPSPPTLYLHRQLLPQEAITAAKMDDLCRLLQKASFDGKVDEVRSLLLERGADVHGRDNDMGQTALHVACYNGHTAIASLLIERGADVHSRDNDGQTALHRASYNGHTTTASLLIERGADVNNRDHLEWTALHGTCMYGHTAIASLLVERGADVHSRDNDGQTALHAACMEGYTVTVSLLIERGSKVDSRDNDGWSALYWACNNGQKETAILLIRSKADIYIQSNDGRALLDLKPQWREELTQLYEEVNRDWLARRPFLLVLIGCNHIESESNKHNASKQTQSERESEEINDEVRVIRDRVPGNGNLLGYKVPGTGIFSFL